MAVEISSLPKIFWKYYDRFRRKQITLSEFSRLTGLTENEIRAYLKMI